MIVNMMTCSGFSNGVMGGCSMAWMGLVLLFFIIMLVRKWIGEEMGVSFNMIFAVGLSFAGYLILMTLTGSSRWAFLSGIVGLAVGGFIVGMFWDTSGGEEYSFG